jgi:hypothetical protein
MPNEESMKNMGYKTWKTSGRAIKLIRSKQPSGNNFKRERENKDRLVAILKERAASKRECRDD